MSNARKTHEKRIIGLMVNMRRNIIEGQALDPRVSVYRTDIIRLPVKTSIPTNLLITLIKSALLSIEKQKQKYLDHPRNINNYTADLLYRHAKLRARSAQSKCYELNLLSVLLLIVCLFRNFDLY